MTRRLELPNRDKGIRVRHALPGSQILANNTNVRDPSHVETGWQHH